LLRQAIGGVIHADIADNLRAALLCHGQLPEAWPYILMDANTQRKGVISRLSVSLKTHDVMMTNGPFVLTKPGTEAGESLADIVARKEAERVAGKGIFWWGIGSSLGAAVCKAAQDAGGKLPLAFVLNNRPSRPKKHDISPAQVFRWTKWQDWNGSARDIPAFAHVTSRGHELKSAHYALVCYSEKPITFDVKGPAFDPSLCRTALGKRPGSSQVTALVWGDLNDPDHKRGQYRIAFLGTLISPWQAKLVSYR
jgi:hypothetical protein